LAIATQHNLVNLKPLNRNYSLAILRRSLKETAIGRNSCNAHQ
jgi:hypothetical protein